MTGAAVQALRPAEVVVYIAGGATRRRRRRRANATAASGSLGGSYVRQLGDVPV